MNTKLQEQSHDTLAQELADLISKTVAQFWTTNHLSLDDLVVLRDAFRISARRWGVN